MTFTGACNPRFKDFTADPSKEIDLGSKWDQGGLGGWGHEKDLEASSIAHSCVCLELPKFFSKKVPDAPLGS